MQIYIFANVEFLSHLLFPQISNTLYVYVENDEERFIIFLLYVTTFNTYSGEKEYLYL